MTDLPRSPWTGRARLAVAAALAVGLALLLIGYTGATGERHLDDEIVWLNLAVIGVLVASTAEISFIIVGRRQVSLLRRQALPGLADAPSASGGAPIASVRRHPPGGMGSGPARPVLLAGGTVTVAGSTWYHRPDCLLVAGKTAVSSRPSDGSAPCAVCSPEPA